MTFQVTSELRLEGKVRECGIVLGSVTPEVDSQARIEMQVIHWGGGPRRDQ